MHVPTQVPHVPSGAVKLVSWIPSHLISLKSPSYHFLLQLWLSPPNSQTYCCHPLPQKKKKKKTWTQPAPNSLTLLLKPRAHPKSTPATGTSFKELNKLQYLQKSVTTSALYSRNSTSSPQSIFEYHGSINSWYKMVPVWIVWTNKVITVVDAHESSKHEHEEECLTDACLLVSILLARVLTLRSGHGITLIGIDLPATWHCCNEWSHYHNGLWCCFWMSSVQQ